MTDPIEIVRRAFQAYVDGDRAALEALIGEDFTFTSPRDNGLDRATYFARCWPSHLWITNFAFRRLIADGDTVVATYEASTRTGRSLCNTEVVTLRRDKIVAVEVYFGWSLPHDAPPGGFVDPDP